MGEEEFEIIANRIADVLDNISDSELHSKIKDEMRELASNLSSMIELYIKISYGFNDRQLR